LSKNTTFTQFCTGKLSRNDVTYIRVTATVCDKVIGLELSDDKVGVSDELMLVRIGITAGLLQ
jgi:hypothetical protein